MLKYRVSRLSFVAKLGWEIKPKSSGTRQQQHGLKIDPQRVQIIQEAC
jgi:hypothetical protein